MKFYKSFKKLFTVHNPRFNVRAYTLIEVVMAIGIFSILIAGPTGFFISSLRSQSRALGLREVIDNTSYFMDYISRALRMARKDDILGVDCLSGTNVNYEITHLGEGIKFRNSKDECQEFYLDGNQLKEDKDGNALFLTSDDLDVSMIGFELSGEEQDDPIQPRITIVLEMTKKDDPDFPKMRIQTTISQRNLDVLYQE